MLLRWLRLGLRVFHWLMLASSKMIPIHGRFLNQGVWILKFPSQFAVLMVRLWLWCHVHSESNIGFLKWENKWKIQKIIRAMWMNQPFEAIWVSQIRTFDRRTSLNVNCSRLKCVEFQSCHQVALSVCWPHSNPINMAWVIDDWQRLARFWLDCARILCMCDDVLVFANSDKKLNTVH